MHVPCVIRVGPYVMIGKYFLGRIETCETAEDVMDAYDDSWD